MAKARRTEMVKHQCEAFIAFFLWRSCLQEELLRVVRGPMFRPECTTQSCASCQGSSMADGISLFSSGPNPVWEAREYYCRCQRNAMSFLQLIYKHRIRA